MMSTVMNQINGDLQGGLFYTRMTVSSAQLLAMSASPVQLLPAPGSNKCIIIKNWGFNLSFNTTAYASGSAVNLFYDTSRTQAAGGQLAVGNLQATVSISSTAIGVSTLVPGANSINKPVYLSCATPYTTGDSSITLFVFYSVISFDFSTTINAINNQTNTPNYNIANVLIPSASVQTLSASPVTIIPAPGAGLAIVCEKFIACLIYNSVNYTAGTLSLVSSIGPTNVITGLTTLIGASSSQYFQASNSFSNFTPSNLSNASIQAKASVSPGASGNSAIRIIVFYSIITL